MICLLNKDTKTWKASRASVVICVFSQEYMWKEVTTHFGVELQDGWGRSYSNCHGLGLKQMIGLKDIHYCPTIVLTM
jgi:hypothetical protein